MSDLLEIGLCVFMLVLASGLSLSIRFAMVDYRKWKIIRRKKSKHFFPLESQKVWRPSYWSQSEVVKLGGKVLSDLWYKASVVFMPFIKGAQLGVQSITAIRAVFKDREMYVDGAFKYAPGTHLTQVLCRACSKQTLGVWLERLPDKTTGEVLSNKPFKAVCLTCLRKLPKENRALYSVAWTEQSNPFEEGEDESDYCAPGIVREMFGARAPLPTPIEMAVDMADDLDSQIMAPMAEVDFWRQQMAPQNTPGRAPEFEYGLSGPIWPSGPTPVINFTSGDTNGDR